MYMFARKRLFSRTPRNERFVNEPELQYYSTDFGSIGLIQMSPIALPLMCILLVNGIRLQREPGAMRIPLARSMGSIMMFTALKAYGSGR